MRVSGDSLETGDLDLQLDKAVTKQEAAYLKHLRELAYEAWEKKHPTEEERAKYPFCEECFEGHDSKKITCWEVQLMIEADNSIWPG